MKQGTKNFIGGILICAGGSLLGNGLYELFHKHREKKKSKTKK